MSLVVSKSAWIASAGILLSCFAGGALVALHAPLRSEVKTSWLDRRNANRQTIYHFVAADCRCSERLMLHLLDRKPREDAQETIVYFGGRRPIHQDLEAAGYELRFETSPAASGIEAAPWLLVRDSGGNVSYSGGYERAPYWESRILFQVEHRILRASLPATGCATSGIAKIA